LASITIKRTNNKILTNLIHKVCGFYEIKRKDIGMNKRIIFKINKRGIFVAKQVTIDNQALPINF
jgi:hypothetical protein